MRKIIIGFLGIILFAACDKKNDPTPGPTIYDRTILVYMSGENDLANNPFMQADLKEMDEGSYQLDDNQHLIVFIDSVGINNFPHIIEIDHGRRKVMYQYDSDFPASDPKKFREVIDWTITHYPSKEYGLVLWGHASGWAVETDTVATSKTRAYGYDYGYDISGATKKSMNITQMAKAMEGLPKLKYIFADCCCFMCAESAYELRNTADYLIGSPAEIPGDGAPYQELVPKLFSKSNTFYKDICDTYYDFYLNYNQSITSPISLKGYSVPLSVINLSQMENLAQATSKVLTSFIPSNGNELDLTGLPFYFGNGGHPVMYDIKSVIHKYAPSYSQWDIALKQAVPYSLISTRWQTIYSVIIYHFNEFPTDTTQYGGISMFFPQDKYEGSTYRYNQRIKNYQWYYKMNWGNYGW